LWSLQVYTTYHTMTWIRVKPSAILEVYIIAARTGMYQSGLFNIQNATLIDDLIPDDSSRHQKANHTSATHGSTFVLQQL